MTPRTCSERLCGRFPRNYDRRLYRIARSILRNDADAEDVVQDAYVSAFTNLASYCGESTLATWLSCINN
jgi:RNA polymerase sigma-70 factor, ECF subfamily